VNYPANTSRIRRLSNKSSWAILLSDAGKEKTKMALDKPVRRIAIVGTGVIGASWAAEFLARGFDVIATDPAPNAEANLRKYIDAAWPALTSMGLSQKASRDRLSFRLDMKKALSDVDLVQENGPERPDFKIKLFADMDAATPPDSIIASSSSGITMSVMQSACTHPERCVVGHPFNPPHMIPLVEVVGGSKTSPDTIRRAIAFYASIGKKPIHLRKEVVGHVANRIQAALYREVVYLISQGVLDVADADTAVSWGPGLRWGVMGPSMLFHLGGGQGGIQHFMDHLSGPVASWWKDLGSFTDWPAGSKQSIVDGVAQEAGGRTVDELARMRDEVLLELVKLRMKQAEASAPAHAK
jgi:3-hydroxyacyl-CoA dehydrogenase